MTHASLCIPAVRAPALCHARDGTSPAPPHRRPRRVALYSHDTLGLGHVRRNSFVAASIVAAEPDTDVLLLTGAPEATALPLPPRTDVVTLPTLHKDTSGGYRPRTLSMSLDEVVAMREGVLDAALGGFAPDLLIVDKVARGAHGEMERALRHVREQGSTTTVLGLRDVLDGPSATRAEWTQTRTDAAVDELYDQVWIYGDRSIFDSAAEYGWPEATTEKLRYTGYLCRGRARLLGSEVTPVDDNAPRIVLGLVGGGQDGNVLAHAFAMATFPPEHTGVLVTGPYFDTGELTSVREIAASRTDLTVLSFVPDVPALVRQATACVSMAGYNSVCELLSTRRPALLAPRTVPRVEQAIRADRLSRAGLVDVVSTTAVTSQRVSDWLHAVVGRRTDGLRGDRVQPVDLDGLFRVPRLAARLLDRHGPEHATQEVRHAAE